MYYVNINNKLNSKFTLPLWDTTFSPIEDFKWSDPLHIRLTGHIDKIQNMLSLLPLCDTLSPIWTKDSTKNTNTIPVHAIIVTNQAVKLLSLNISEKKKKKKRKHESLHYIHCHQYQQAYLLHLFMYRIHSKKHLGGLDKTVWVSSSCFTICCKNWCQNGYDFAHFRMIHCSHTQSYWTCNE